MQPYFIHPLFRNIERNFRYFLVSMGAISQKEIQEAVKKAWPTISIGTTILFDGNSCLIFDVAKTIGDYNREFGVKYDGGNTFANLNSILETQARLMIIYVYDVIVGSSYNGRVRRELNNFLYHIRNAAAHDNRFVIRKRQTERAEWRGKVINPSLQGQLVFNKFVSPADIILLILDVSEELKRVDDGQSASNT